MPFHWGNIKIHTPRHRLSETRVSVWVHSQKYTRGNALTEKIDILLEGVGYKILRSKRPAQQFKDS